MNRYPLWKYAVIAVALLFGVLYTLPNFFGESPAVQIASAKATVKVEADLMPRVEQILQEGNLTPDGVFFEASGTQGSVRARFLDTDSQFKAKSLLESKLNPDQTDPAYSVAFNLVPNTPLWLQSLHAFPMYLGLDLRGGVHFLMQVDTKALLNKRLQGLLSGARGILRDKNIRHAGITRAGDQIEISFRDADTRSKASAVLASDLQDVSLAEAGDANGLKLIVTLKPEALKTAQQDGVQQNITTLSKRVNELGVAEPVIQRQGADRIVV